MTPINKIAMRAAVRIHEQLAERERQDSPVNLPEYSWNNIQRLRRRIDLAHQRGWDRAASHLTKDLASTLEICRRELENALRTLQSRPTERKVSSASDIYRDILALYDEFEEVDIDWGEHKLSVTTDRIVLEDVRFGAFQIRLDWHHLGNSPAYRVVALDPNPASKSDDITHPHVQDEHLCEGEGRSAIRAALTECRLHDFFILVSQLLHTYGRGSAYVEVSDWEGVSCTDCGASMSQDDSYGCQRCGSELCDECRRVCTACEESFCSDCLGQCPGCDNEYCSSCMGTCSVCRKQFCADCLKDGGLCQSCDEKQHNEEKENDSSQTKARKPTVRSTTGRRRKTACASA